MSLTQDPDLIDSLEEGFTAVPVSGEECAAAVALCVIVRRQRDPVAGNFVILRPFASGRALLGALRDSSGRIVEWLELWLPVREGPDGTVAQSNAAWGEMWAELDRTVRETDPLSYLGTTAPNLPRRPVYIDLTAMTPWHPVAEQGTLVLCRDDAALAAAGLPVFSTSAARFAWVPGVADSFTSLNEQAKSAGGKPLTLPRDDGTFVPLNPECWPVIVRAFAPLTIGDFAALLGGQPWRGDDSALKPCRLNRAYRELSDLASLRCGGRHFFTNRHGAAGLVSESLYLKLQLAVQAMEAVREYVSRRQLPMLNLTAGSFRVRLGSRAAQLPILWTGQVGLAVPGDAVALPVPHTQERFFRPGTPLRESIYRPEELTRRREGIARVRLRTIFPPTEEGVVVEATISTPEELRVDLNELIELRLPLADGAVGLIGYLDPKIAMARGEAGFRSLPLSLDARDAQALSGAAGVIFTHVPMEVQVPLSSPCDVYSLGVLSLQILFAGGDVTLPEAKDSLFSLAAQLNAEFAGARDLSVAVAEVFKHDPRWLTRLGPQHMMTAELGAAEAAELIPMQLWSRVLMVLLRLFPGRSPFAFCQDFGDAPPLALHTVFDRALEPMNDLLRITRSMHLMDWKQNREIASMVEKWIQPV
jgi:hypothetical protein